VPSGDYANTKQAVTLLGESFIWTSDQALEKVSTREVSWSVVAFKEKSQVLADQYGWPLSIAKGYADGRNIPQTAQEPPIHAMVRNLTALFGRPSGRRYCPSAPIVGL